MVSSPAALVSFLQGGRQPEAEQCYKYAVKVRASMGSPAKGKATGKREGSRPTAFPHVGVLALPPRSFI